MGRKHRTVITDLELAEKPTRFVPRPLGAFAVLRAEAPPLHFYRYLYDSVGRNHVWVERKRLSDEALADIIHHEDNLLYVLYGAGVPAGFAELDQREATSTELALFGLMPEFVGRGLGRWFLNEIIALAWTRPIERMTVNTCTLDHPGALPLYQKAGFIPVGRREAVLEEPD